MPLFMSDEGDLRLGNIFAIIIAAAIVLPVVGCAVKVINTPAVIANAAIDTAHGVIRHTMSADNALVQYRWLHDASAQLDNYPSRIRLASNLAHLAAVKYPDRAMARETELAGLQQVCMSTAAEYNSRASRIDSGFFRNPEQWLPVRTEAWTPLPPSYSTKWCEIPTESETQHAP